MNSTSLSLYLEDLLQRWRDARKPQEQKLVEWYSDYMRIPRDDDTKGSGAARSKQAKGIFIGSTRNKVRAARAKILDSMFGANKFPFDTEPVNEELKEFADAFEVIIEQQLTDAKVQELLTDGVDEITKFGTGFIFGPFADKKEHKRTSRTVDDYGIPRIQTAKIAYPCPRWDLAQTIEVYPDPAATDEQKGGGVFWCSMESLSEVRKWRSQPGYKNIDEALLITKGDGDGSTEGRQHLEQARKNLEFWYSKESGRVRVARFFGYAPASMVQEMHASEEEGEGLPHADEQYESDEDVPVMAIVIGGVCVRCEPLPWDKRPAARCVYEKAPHEMWGVGVAENNAATQKITNAAVRLFLEGKGHALLPQRSIDRSLFLPSENFQVSPGKTYQFKAGLTPEQRNTAIMFHQTPDVTQGWQDVIAMAEQFSDDDTAVTKYSQGNDANHLNKTATGISMIMGASSLPIKEVLRNIDQMWVERIIADLIEWDLEFLEVEHVRMLHGDELAQKWQAIKQYGQAHFMKWKATGAATFMAKEVLLNKLMGFINMVGATPPFQALVDMRELLEQAWDLTQIGRESPILKDEDLTIDKLPPQVQQMIQQLQEAAAMGEQAMQQIEMIKQQAMDEIGKRDQQINEMRLAMADKSDQNEIKAFEAETDRMQVEGDQANTQLATLAQVEMNEANGYRPQD